MESNRNILKDHTYALQLFCCKHCLKEFRNKYTFARHVQRDHDGQKTLHLCNVCNKIFPTKAKLHCHSVVNHKKKAKFYCKICKTYWINKDMFLAHLSTHAGENRLYTCVECNRKYKTIGKFKVHRALHFKKKLQGECKVCLKKLSDAKLLRMHKCEKAVTSLVLSSLVPILQNNKTMVVAVHVPCVEKQGNESLVNEQPNNSIDLEKLNSRNEQFNVIQPITCVPGSYQMKRHSSKTFQCRVCGDFFLGRPVLSQHLKDSAMCRSRNFSCEKCKEVFSTQEALTNHLVHPVYCNAYVKGKPFECDFCSRTFDKRGSFKLHMDTHVKDRNHVCVGCGRKFVHIGHLTQHYSINKKCREGEEYEKYLESIKPGIEYKCKECGRCDFKNAITLYSHRRRSHSKDVVCKKCGAKFVRQDCLRKHERYSCMGDHPCKFCGKKGFKNRQQLSAHLKEHDPSYGLKHTLITDSKPFKCEKCNMTFTRQLTLLQHQRLHCPGGLMCHFCAKADFRDKRQFQKHMTDHDPSYSMETENLNERSNFSQDYFCNVCDAAFDSKYSKKTHMSRVHGEKCICEICGAVLATPKSLSDHEQHVHVAKDVCDICGKAVRTKNLIAHKRRHTGETPYNCKACGKGFKSTDSMRYHTRVQKCGV